MNWMRWASGVMFAGIALGAFGAHGLRDVLSPDAKKIYETAVFYHLIHGLALLAVAGMALRRPNSILILCAGFAFLAGILFFSGSLYLLAITGVKKWGMITPLGGLSFLLGWFLVFLSAKGS